MNKNKTSLSKRTKILNNEKLNCPNGHRATLTPTMQIFNDLSCPITDSSMAKELWQDPPAKVRSIKVQLKPGSTPVMCAQRIYAPAKIVFYQFQDQKSVKLSCVKNTEEQNGPVRLWPCQNQKHQHYDLLYISVTWTQNLNPYNPQCQTPKIWSAIIKKSKYTPT